jgi:hypothetical protein
MRGVDSLGGINVAIGHQCPVPETRVGTTNSQVPRQQKEWRGVWDLHSGSNGLCKLQILQCYRNKEVKEVKHR